MLYIDSGVGYEDIKLHLWAVMGRAYLTSEYPVKLEDLGCTIALESIFYVLKTTWL